MDPFNHYSDKEVMAAIEAVHLGKQLGALDGKILSFSTFFSMCAATRHVAPLFGNIPNSWNFMLGRSKIRSV